ncbi:hypothetical protein E2C01_022824 [Portunus trituberculatus]|uniref:Uncharacterized protein n=1 Tax=Portunus trituberculatus TaxID=210409 RepID=A0A5B7E9D6_PORTR|nr:hypothetical protein [Portunus trituberculatus]
MSRIITYAHLVQQPPVQFVFYHLYEYQVLRGPPRGRPWHNRGCPDAVLFIALIISGCRCISQRTQAPTL